MFLSSLSLEDRIKGAKLYNRGQSNDLVIDYGQDWGEDFYIAFWDLGNWLEYETEIDGRKVLDDSKVLKLKLSYENFESVFRQWDQILKATPQYLILSQDEVGWIDIFGKGILSEDKQMLVEKYNLDQERWRQEAKGLS